MSNITVTTSSQTLQDILGGGPVEEKYNKGYTNISLTNNGSVSIFYNNGADADTTIASEEIKPKQTKFITAFVLEDVNLISETSNNTDITLMFSIKNTIDKQENILEKLTSLDGKDISTETKQDIQIGNQTNGTQKSKDVDSSGNIYDVQNPKPTNGDSIYAKDINVSGSDVGTFTGLLTSLVDDLDTTFSSTGHSSPANFTIKLYRPINNTSIKFCSPIGKNFSNVKITLQDRSGAVVATVDDSGNSTKYTSNTYDYASVTFCTILIEFYTTDDIDLNWAIMEKAIDVHAIVRIRKPDGTYVDAGGTAAGNQKFSLEELELEAREYLNLYPVGTGSNGSVTLTSANTAYAIPTTPPTGSYTLNINSLSDVSIFIGYENSNANGMEFMPGDPPVEILLGASQSVYAYCASAGKVVSYTLKEIN